MRFTLAAVWIGVGCGLAAAQTADAGFDSASIKPAKPDARGYSIRPLPGRVSAENVTLKQLIGEAYHVHDFQIAGGPKWIDSVRYDVEGKAGSGGAPDNKQLRAMLQTLLADRFGLTVRHESKEMAAYLLEAGNRGPKLQKPQHPDAPVMFRVFQRRQITAANAPLENLTEALTWLLARPVLDRTGLQGSFDYKLEWAPDELQVASQEAPPQTDGSAPSLDAALQQQIGLKLVPKKTAVDVILVTRADAPALN